MQMDLVTFARSDIGKTAQETAGKLVTNARHGANSTEDVPAVTEVMDSTTTEPVL